MMLRKILLLLLLISGLLSSHAAERPNMVLFMADDWGWPHAGAYRPNKPGAEPWIETPNFDRLASEGALFTNAFTPCPSCTAARGSTLTGLYPWKLGTGASIYGTLPARLTTYTDVLAENGYRIAYTGKAWGPGPAKAGGRRTDPGGKAWNGIKRKRPTSSSDPIDYAANFTKFLADLGPDEPFCFWFGPKEPHRPYEWKSGAKKGGLDPNSVVVPGYFPDHPDVRHDLLDYALEIRDLDDQIGRMVEALREAGRLDNTLIVVTGDHGMPHPRAKKNLYEHGVHVPFAVRWSGKIQPGRVVEDLISFIDIAPTFLEAAGLPEALPTDGRSLMPLLTATDSGFLDPEANRYVFLGMDRHGPVKENEKLTGMPGTGYPARAIRDPRLLYIHNLNPSWFPNSPDAGATGTTITKLHQSGSDEGNTFGLSYSPRPEFELYNVIADPGCLDNLADDPDHAADLKRLREQLETRLRESRDPTTLGYGGLFFATPFYKAGPERYGDWDRRTADFLAEKNEAGIPNALSILLGLDLPDAAEHVVAVDPGAGLYEKLRVSRIASDFAEITVTRDGKPAVATRSDSDFDYYEPRNEPGADELLYELDYKLSIRP